MRIRPANRRPAHAERARHVLLCRKRISGLELATFDFSLEHALDLQVHGIGRVTLLAPAGSMGAPCGGSAHDYRSTPLSTFDITFLGKNSQCPAHSRARNAVFRR